MISMRYLFSSLIFLTIFTGCSIKQIDTNNIANEKEFTLKYSKNIYYDDIEKELVYEELTLNRPSNGSFKTLYFQDNILKMSFDIQVIDMNKADINKPIKTIKRYTSNGFKVGVQIVGHGNSNEPAVLLIPIITTIGGFTIGVIASTPDILNELKDSIIVDKTEILNHYSIYNYDENNELKNITRKVK